MSSKNNPSSEEKKDQTAEEAPEVKDAAKAPIEEKTEPERTPEKTEPEKTPEEPKKEAPKKAEPTDADKLREANDKYLRLLAEYDNFRKRSQKERDSLYGDIKADTVTRFLPVYDNLVRALAQSTEDEAYRKGVEMIMAQFDETLKNLGAIAIPSVGEKFDPCRHNAVMHVEDDTKGENEIVEEFQKGFILGDKVIRCAMVKVAN